jgi:hypothetical protein
MGLGGRCYLGDQNSEGTVELWRQGWGLSGAPGHEAPELPVPITLVTNRSSQAQDG